MSSAEPKTRTRKVYGELPARVYLELELEAFERGLSPYQLVSRIVATHLRGRLQKAASAAGVDSPGPSSSSSVAGT